MKRKMAMALAAVLVAGSLPVTASAATFRDINEVSWAAGTISEVADKGLISGYEDNTFRGKNNVTYSEAMQMLYNIMNRTGNLKSSALGSQAAYQSVMTLYQIPGWAQSSVAYGLASQALTAADLPKFVTNGVSNAATRQDVVVMFGRALSDRYDIYAGSGVDYGDAWRITADAMPYVDLMTRLGIISGDDNGNFNPTANITRAEMAVIMNKTYDLLANEQGDTGVITDIVNNNGDYYDIDVQMDNGERKKITLMDDNISILSSDGSREMPVSVLSKGDKISLVFDGDIVTKVYLLNEETSAQAKYDITGYIYSLKETEVNFESENTGETTKYKIDDDCVFYLDGKKTTYKTLKDEIDSHSDQYAYAGLYTKTENEKNSSGNRVDVEYVTAMYVTILEEYTHTGEVTSMDEESISYKMSGSNANKDAKFASGCTFYIGEEKADVDELIDMVDSGTAYIKITVDKNGRATNIIMAEDKFEDDSASSATYRVNGFNEDYIRIRRGGETVEYTLDSINNISFYTWNVGRERFDSVDFDEAEEYYDDAKEDEDVYARIGFNNGGKIGSIYFAYEDDREAAFDEAESTERKGTVASIEDGILKFKTSSTEYILQNRYNVEPKADEDTDGDEYENGVKYPLEIGGAQTSSLTVLTRMANCDDVTLYAEIKADSDNKVTKIEARLTAASGKLVEYDKGKKEFTLETSDGSQFKLYTVSNPKTDSDDYDAEDLETTGYRNSAVELEFNNSGEISKIIVTDSAYNSGTKRVKGTASVDGSKIKIDGTSYSWDSKTSINSSSFSYDTKSMFERMLEDSNIEVYVEATISDKNKVERISATVESAEGEFVEYDSGTVKIKTDSRTWAFNTVSKNTLAKNCGVDHVDDLEKWEGDSVELVFDNDGIVEEIVR